VRGVAFLNDKQAIKCQIELMEKEILYFKGYWRKIAKEAYYRLLHTCGDSCKINQSIFLKRRE
jgi:hypothetical protein